MTKRVPLAAAGLLALCSASCVRTVQDPSSRMSAPPVKRARSSQKTPKVKKSKAVAPIVQDPAAHTGTRETFSRQVRNAADAGEGDLRVKSWRQRLATNPDDLEARLALARYYKELGFGDVAVEHYRIAVLRAPQNAEAVVGLARTLDSMGLGAQARTELEQFVTAHPDESADAHSWLGILRDDAKEYQAAESSHRAALRLRDQSDAFHNNLGYNLLLQGKHEEAAAEFRRALTLAPGSALARNNLAMALAGQPGAAMTELREVADPATAHSNLAAILIERGQLEAARRQVELALGYRKDHPAALGNLALIAQLEGGSVSLSQYEAQSPWQRFLRTMGDVLFGSKDEPKSKQTAGTAGRNEILAPGGAGSQ